jgi:hypothetical protein
MIRPKNWDALPYAIREHIVDTCDLDYCRYESSFAEAVHNLLNDPFYYPANNMMAQQRYESMSDADLMDIAKCHIRSLEYQIETIKTMLR